LRCSLVCALALAPQIALAQTSCGGGTADLTVAGSQTLNTYYPAPLMTTSIAAGSASIPVDDLARRGGVPIAAGDLVLILQIQGAAIDPRQQDVVGGLYGARAGGEHRMGRVNDPT